MIEKTAKKSVFRSKPLTEEEKQQVQRLVDMGLSWKEISKRTGFSTSRIDKYFRRRKSGRIPRISPPPEELVRPVFDESGQRVGMMKNIDALYDPCRDGVCSPPDLTGQLMGDPPVGRRELLESWAKSQMGKTE